MDAMTPAAMLAAIPPEQKPVTHDVTLVTTRKLAQAKVMGVPPEEFGIERGARSIKDANYCFHEVVTKTQAQLIAEGFDEEQIKALDDYTGNSEFETLARDSVQEHFSDANSGSVNSAARLVKITEHYVRMDYEGDGKPCLYQVITGGGQGEVLRKDGQDCITPFDAMPFAGATPVPITHRFFGRSIADLVMDIQRIKTALLRGTLDNAYMVTNPRNEIAESHAGPNTLDDLLTSRPNGVIRTKMPGGLNVIQTPPIAQYIAPVMEYMDGVREMRTGVTRQSQGVDANALQNQSATAVAQAFSASQMRMKLVARILAEGVRDMFSLLHMTIRKHGQQQQTVRLRNTWIDVDPRDWKTRNDMTINVGLGTGGKAQQFAQMMALANIQKELIIAGKTNLVDDQAIFNMASEISKIMGHKSADKFFNDPSAKDPKTGEPLHPPAQPPEDPKVTALKLKAQTDQAAMQQKAAIEKLQADADIATQDRKTQAEIALADRKAQLEAQLALLDMEMKREEHSQKMTLAQQQHEMTVHQSNQQHEQALQKGHMDMAARAQDSSAKGEENKARLAQTRAKGKMGTPEQEQAKEDKQTKLLETLNEAVKNLSRPKRIVRGKDGRASHVEPM